MFLRKTIGLYTNKSWLSTKTSSHKILATSNLDTCPRVEIQTRTIFEEGWSEINHKLVYKKGTGNQGLKKTSDVLSSMVGACDTIGMLMKTLYDTGIRSDGKELERKEVASQEDDVVQVIRNFLRQ